MIVQAGAYAEHQITRVRTEAAPGAAEDAQGMLFGRPSVRRAQQREPEPQQDVQVDGSHVAVRLAPGAGTRLVIDMQRYVNQPTFAQPWV